MKTKFQSAWILIVLLVGSALFTACNEDNDTPQEMAQPTEEDAVDALTGAMQNSTEGLSQEVETAAELSDEYAEKTGDNPCTDVYDSTFVRSLNGNRVSGEYSFFWEWSLDCNENDLPVTLNYLRTAEGQYETNRMISDDAARGTWTVDNLIAGANYVFNGTYERSGSQESKVRNKNKFSSEITIEVEGLNVTKGSKRIESGTAEVTLILTSPQGASQTFSGDIVFEGNGMATVIINGNSYSIDLRE